MKNKFSNSIDRTNMFYWQSDRPFNGKETIEVFLKRHQNFDRKLMAEAISYGMQQYGKSKKEAEVINILDPIPSGSVNIVSKATLVDGTKVVLRAHPPKIPNGYFWAEKIATEIASRNKVPVYQTYYIYDQRARFDFDFMLIEQLKGNNIAKEMTLTPKLDKKITRQTGYYAYLINSIPTTKYGFFNNQIAKNENRLEGIHDTWKAHIYAALEENLKYLTDQQIINTQQSNQFSNIFTKHEDIIICNKPGIIHNDIADWNELATDDGIVTGMIDWDECFSGDSVMEFAAYSLFYDEPRMSWFKEGYTKEKPLPDGFEEKYHLYRIRYIISKLHLRQKKLEYSFSKFIQEMMEFGLNCLNDELKWYGVK